MTDAEHRAKLAKLFGSAGLSAAQTPSAGTPSAADILNRIRQKSAPPPPDPLRIIRSDRDCKLRIARWSIGTYWWVEFNRPFLMPELDRVQEWCAENCTGAFAPPDTATNTVVRFYDETDWNLFITAFK